MPIAKATIKAKKKGRIAVIERINLESSKSR
jgi:hypothetical protein